MELYVSQINVKVLSEDIKEDKATVEVEYTGYNTDMSRSFLENLKAGKVETRKGKLNLTKVDKAWKIDIDDDYNALIFGGAEMSPENMK